MERKRTKVIVLGELEISGSKIVRKKLQEPIAKAKVYGSEFIIYPAPDIRKIILRVVIKYKEATTKQDIPSFFFILSKDGKEIKKVFVSHEDLYEKYEEFFNLLDIEIDLEKYNYKNLEFDAHLECELDYLPWKAEAYAKYEVLRAEKDAKIKVSFDAPELTLKILPTQNQGKNLKDVNINTDWGNPYFLNLYLENKTKNILKVGAFDLFENNQKIKQANLSEDLQSGQKTIIISEHRSEGAATWILEKGPEDWTWYKQDPKDSNKFITDKLNKIYEYQVNGKIAGNSDRTWENLESNRLKVNVRVPDYKINALDLYNKVIVAEWIGVGLVAVLNIALGLLIKYSKNPKFKDLEFQSKAGAGITIESFITGQALRKLAKDVKDELKVVMDDPPKLDKNYKSIYNIPKIKYAQLMGMDNFTKLFLSFVNKSKKFVLQLRAMRITNNRFWTAKIKKDNAAARVQSKALLARKRELVLNFANLSKISRKLYSKIKIFAKQDIVLAQQEKLRIIKQAGLRRTYVSYGNIRLSKQQVNDLADKFKFLSQLFSRFGGSLK